MSAVRVRRAATPRSRHAPDAHAADRSAALSPPRHVFAEGAQAPEVRRFRRRPTMRQSPLGRQARRRRPAARGFGRDAVRLFGEQANRRRGHPQQDEATAQSRRRGAGDGRRLGHCLHRSARRAGRRFLAAAPLGQAARPPGGSRRRAKQVRAVNANGAPRREQNRARPHQAVPVGGLALSAGLVPLLPVVFALRIRGDSQTRLRQRRGARRQAARTLPPVRRRRIRPRSLTPAPRALARTAPA